LACDEPLLEPLAFAPVSGRGVVAEDVDGVVAGLVVAVAGALVEAGGD
jgi:hypothetical protein